jgi:ubiquinone/menaquinone biosynthesis C-methylase UbiE
MDDMAKKKATVLEELQRVRLIGPAMAESLYSEHKVRSLSDLVQFGKDGHLTDLQGVGKKKAQTILSSAQRLHKDAEPPPRTPEKQPSSRASAAQTSAKKPTTTPPKKPAKSPSRSSRSADANGGSPISRGPSTASTASTASGGAAASTATSETSTDVTNGKTPPQTSADVVPRALHDRFIDTLRCPACGHDAFDVDATTLTCQACQRQFNFQNGIADLAPPHVPSRSMTQKLMESRFYAQFYEEFMRPRLTGVVSNRSMREEYRLAADFLDIGAHTRLLDVGCGTANFTRYFAQRIGLAETPATRGDLPLVVGMDLSWPMLENARRNIRQENLDGKVFLLRGDGTRIPVRRGAFNRLHCAGTLHLMNDIDEALRNFARVLEPDGVCVIGSFILGKGLVRRLVKRAAEFPTRFHWFSREELHRRVERAGFEILDDSVAGDAITLKARRI